MSDYFRDHVKNKIVHKVTNQCTRAQVSFKARNTTVDSLTTLKKKEK